MRASSSLKEAQLKLWNPMLVWNEFEFIECLEVLPEKDEEYETSHVFRVQKNGLTLLLTIYQFSGDVYLPDSGWS